MRYILISLFTLLVFVGKANNVRVTDPNIIDPLEDEPQIGIRVSWDNSWRCEPGHAPNNYDAAWIFVKYKRSDKGDWQHLTIKSTKPGNDSQHRASDKLGVMVYRKNPGYGTFSDTLTIIWERVADIEVASRPTIASEICVFAIEMVQIPEGAFYMGDGTKGDNYSVWSAGGLVPIQPYKVLSEASIGVSNTTTTQSLQLIGKPNVNFYQYSHSGGIQVAFPKGYAEFFCMKTEISQGQYCAFLNKLNKMEISTDNIDKLFSFVSLSFNDEAEQIKYGNTITENSQGVFEVGDPYRACNFLTSLKVLAYLSWSGLRPMTEMEYEKACRGPLTPRPGEFAWGRPAPTNKTAKGFLYSDGDETYTFNSNTDSANYYISALPRPGSVATPGRVGAFAQKYTTRIEAGASYYGVLDMSGGLAELVVTVSILSIPANFAYSRVHGNGKPLRLNGGSDSWPSTWPKITSATQINGYGHRGGHFMCKPASGGVNAKEYDPSSGIVSALGYAGGNGSGSLNVPVYTYQWDYSYGYNASKSGYFLHGYGGRGVRSF